MSLNSPHELGPMAVNWTHPSYSLAPHRDAGALGVNSTLVNATGGTDVGSGFYLYQKILIGITLSIMTFIAIVGNILVVAAVFTDRRLKRYSNFFIVSLAIADLLVAVGVMTFAIANDVQGVWYFGPVFCKIWVSADVMCCTASILNLCVISLDRYIHIKDPLHYDAWMTARKTYLFIAVVWVLSLVISFLPIQMGWHKRNETEEVTDDSCAFAPNSVYAVVSSSISFYIPCIVMLSIYLRLYMYARRHVESIKRTHTADRFHQNHGSAKSSYKVSDHKAAVTLGIIMGVFLLCWVPFFIMNPIAAFCDNCIPKVAFQILTWLGYANSALNPIIYSIFNQEFRDAFRRILCPRWCNERRQMNMFATTIKKKKVIKSEYTPPLMENGSTSASTIRKNSRERLFAEKITSL